MKSSTDQIRKTIEIKAPPARVWRALTNYQEFSAWFGLDLESPFVAGQATRGRKMHPDHGPLTLELVVQTMEPERLFSYHWHPDVADPRADFSRERPTLVEFRLEPIATGTRLTVTESGFDAIAARRRDEAFRKHAEGWALQIERIENYVATTP